MNEGKNPTFLYNLIHSLGLFSHIYKIYFKTFNSKNIKAIIIKINIMKISRKKKKRKKMCVVCESC